MFSSNQELIDLCCWKNKKMFIIFKHIFLYCVSAFGTVNVDVCLYVIFQSSATAPVSKMAEIEEAKDV